MKGKRFKNKKVVFRQGDSGDSMYYVQWGSVGVFVNYGTAAEKQLATLHTGDYFGEMGLIDHETRSATVVSLSNETTLVRIDETEFKEFLRTNPAKVHDIVGRLSHKLRAVTRDYLDVCQKVQQTVGADVDEVDESSSYQFLQNADLMAIHDRVQEEKA